MFFFVFFAIGFLLTAFLSPKAKIENARASTLNDFSFPRADEGDPVTRIYGTVKQLSPNTVFIGGFKAVAIKKKQKTGLFSSKMVTVGFKYYITMDLSICLGPNFVFKRVWTGKYELFNGCFFGDVGCNNVVTVNRPEMYGGNDTGNGGFVGEVGLYCGAFDQPQDAHLQALIFPDNSNQVPRYGGIAHMVYRNCYIGNTVNIDAISIEGSCFTNTLGLNELAIMPNGLDANPIEVLYDIYVSDWGNLAIDTTLINTEQWRAIGAILYAEGNGMSLMVGNSNTGGDVTKEILRQIGATIFQDPSTGLFELVLIRNDYAIEDLPVFGPGEIIELTNFTKILWEETVNAVRVKYTDRAQGYKQNTVALQTDPGNIRFQKRIKAVDESMPGIYTADLANTIAARDLAQQNVPLYQAEVSLNREAITLAPGRPFVLNWPEYGITQMVMRVKKFGLGTLKDGTVTMSIVQDEFALDDVIMAPPVGSPYTPPSAAPGIVTPIWFELPYWLRVVSGLTLDPTTDFLALMAVPPTVASTGYTVVTTYTTTTNAQVLTNEPYTATARLRDDFGRFEGFLTGYAAAMVIKDVTDEALMTSVSDSIASGSPARQGHGLFYLNGEIGSFVIAVHNGDGSWTLEGVRRGLLDSPWKGGVANDVLYFFEGQTGFLPDGFGPPPLEGDFVGKIQDITVQGSIGLEDLDEITVTPIQRAEFPLPPDGIKANGDRHPFLEHEVGDTVTLTWLERDKTYFPADLKFEGDATEPVTGTLYRIKVEDPYGNLIAIVDDLAATTYDLTFTNAMVGPSVILIWAKLDGFYSYAPAPYPVIVGTGFRITERGEYRVTEDDDLRVEE